MLSQTLLITILLCLLPCLHLDASHMKYNARTKLHVHNETDVDNMSDKDVRSNYFLYHDMNNDNRLDGLEIMHSILHYQEEDESLPESTYSDKELAWFMDVIMGRGDRNDDGFIDYLEFITYKSVD